LARGSGGWTSPKENQVSTEAPKAQLYDLSKDPGEQNNLYKENPEIANELLQKLTDDIKRGRSTEGAKSGNDVDGIVLWKSESPKKKKKNGKSK
jgi:hypothetical protein